MAVTASLGYLNTFAQDAGLLRTDLISPSPTAAQLAKYGDIPVTYYTGLPNISIPIFNVTGNELSLPITLTYNYSGAQPGQKASWVGLGWSLQAGGVITRTVGDRLDDANGYDIDSASQMSPTQTYLKNSRYYGMFDNLPDVYSFNFGNYSGKFIYENGNYYIMPKQTLKISGNGGGDFVITTEEGTKYFFEAREYTTAKPVAPAPGSAVYNIPQHTSAWYLTRISNATDTESIRLTYDEDGTMEQFGVRTQTYRKPTSTINQEPQVSPPGDLLPTRVTVQRLTSITSDKYQVDFFTGTARQDIEMLSGSTYSLGGIRVNSKTDQVKYFDFEHDYTSEETALRLRSVTENAGGGRLYKHTFSYLSEGQSVGSGISSPVDKFGYLRDGVENGTLISNEIWEYGVDRTPQFHKLSTGALQTITYPAGGSTTFTYELNRYNDGDRNTMDNEARGMPAIRYNPSTTNEIYGIDTFQVTHEQYVKILFTRADKEGPYDPETDPTEVWHDNVPEFEIRPVYLLVDDEGNFPLETVGAAVYEGKIVLNEDNDGKTDSVSLDPGKYIIRTICDDHELEVTAAAFYEVDTGIPAPGAPGPGLRVKSVLHNNGFGKTIQKRFTYVKENGQCSGELLQSTSYQQQTPMTDVTRSMELFGAIVESTNYVVYTSMVSERGDTGLPFYYKRVIEDTESGTEVHRTAYAYNYFASTQNVELLTKTEYVQRDGAFIPLAKDEFTFSGQYSYGGVNGMEIYVSEHHSYVENPLTGYDVYDFISRNWGEFWKHPLRTKQTRYENGQELVTETRSYYDGNGTRNLVATKATFSDGSTLYTKYKYPEDYSGISEISGMVSAHMLSPVIEEQVWHKSPGGDSLMISGRINEYDDKRLKAVYVLESATGITAADDEDAVTVSGVTKYVNLVSDSRYKKKITFTYDQAGRLASQQLTDHPVVSYLWGYPGFTETGSPVHGNTYPVAEIKNALPESVFYTSFEETGISAVESFSGKKCKADSFKIQKIFAGNYMLTYWKKTGSDPWRFVQQTLSNPSNHIISAIGSYIDEVRLYPADAQMTTYTYRPGMGIAQVIDANNRVTHYEYDVAGRLTVIKDDSKNITNTYQYHVKDEAMLSVE
jgi:YD repeat-containing protein